MVKRWELLADQDGAHRAAEAINERRTVSLHELDGGIDLRASGGSPLKTAAMPADARLPVPVLNIVSTQEQFDHSLLLHGLIDVLDGANTDPFADLLHAYCETDNGVPVISHDILRVAMTGYVRRVVVDSQSVITNFGRTRRPFNDNARTALKLLIRHCDHVGCDIGAERLHIDHLDEWVRDNGTTDLDNGRLKCSGQNRNKNRLGLTEKRDRYGKVIQFRRDGTSIAPVGQRLRLEPKPEIADKPWPTQHLAWIA